VILPETRIIERLFDQYANQVLGYLRAMTCHSDLAEDALQEAFVRLARRAGHLSEVNNLRGYLFRIARNEALRILRREKRRMERHQALASSELIQSRPGAAEHSMEIERLERELQKLPDRQREVVYLKCVEGLTFAQIGEVIGASQDTAASRYRYGMAKLRNALTKSHDED